MNTKILEYIIAIAQEKSISRAAERFYLTQPVLSRHLKKIEDRVGTPLFVRQKDGMALTEAGRIYINSAQNILHLEDKLEREMADILRQKKAFLHLYAELSFARILSDHVLPIFHEKNPDVQVRITVETAEEIQAALAGGEAGIGILSVSERRDPAIEYITLHQDEFVLLRPDNERAADTIFLRPTGTSQRAMEDRWLRQAGMSFSTVLEVPTYRAGAEEMRRGQGCAIALKTMAEFLGLTPSPDIAPLPFLVCAAYPKDMVFRPVSHTLMQTIIKVFGEWRYAKTPQV